jgi:hypothetical protein
MSYKGLLDIEIVDTSSIFLLRGNTFTQNSGIIDSNVLSIRRFADPATDTCGEITIESNTFNKNIGCSETNGVAYVYCKNSHSVYIDSIDTWYTPDMTVITPLKGQVGVKLTNNLIEFNFAGTNRSIIEISGFPKVTFDKNRIVNNENWLPSSFKSLSPIYSL